MTCEECKALRAPETIPFVVHESAMARAERAAKRLWLALILLIVLLVGTNVAWMVYECQFEDVSSSESYEADAMGGGTAIINGSGEVDLNGPSEGN